MYTGDYGDIVQSSEWQLNDMFASRHEMIYACCPDPYPDVTYTMILSRRPMFYVLTVLFPSVTTAIVASFAFILPPEAGEKISIGVTVLLSLAVFLLVISDSMPASPDSFPYVGMWLLVFTFTNCIYYIRL
jgi:nicotinic acetylcholine receptor